MAREVIERIVCDRCGKDGSSTVGFAVGRVTYELDLCDQDGARFQADLDKWTTKARRVAGARSGSARKPGPKAHGPVLDTAAIRDWAKSQRIKVSDRGRLSADVVAKYNAAQS